MVKRFLVTVETVIVEQWEVEAEDEDEASIIYEDRGTRVSDDAQTTVVDIVEAEE